MKVKIRIAQINDLKNLALCHMSAFPKSLTTAMGSSYVKKTLEWYITEPDAFLIMAENEKKEALGYAGGLLVHEATIQGSTSAMSQYALKTALFAFILRPWLLFHPQIRRHFPYIRYFLKRQLLKYYGKKKISESKFKPKSQKAQRLSIGLVGIGVTREFQGKGVGSELLRSFEDKALSLGAEYINLSVDPDNNKAIRSYERNGWQRVENTIDHYVMKKELRVMSC